MTIYAGEYRDNAARYTVTATFNTPAPVVPVERVTLSHTRYDLTRGEVRTPTLTIHPTNATNRSVQYTSSNTAVATVSNSGSISAVGSGTATITYTVDGVSATCVVTVTIPVTSVTVRQTNPQTSYKVGSSGTVSVTISPSDATDKSIQYSVDNTSSASITQDGRFTTRFPGIVNITATSTNGRSHSTQIIVAPSSITLPNRRLTNAELITWINDYRVYGAFLVELEVVRLVNIERTNRGLASVSIDQPLMQAARFFAQQANDLRGLYSGTHNFGPYATNPSAQHGASANVAAAFGGRLRWNGGNWYSGGMLSASFLVNGWMNSPGHRDYILSPEHRFIGVGQYPGGISYMFLSDRASIPIG